MAAPPINTQLTTISVDDGSGTPVIINGAQSISDIGSGKASEKNVTTLASTQVETRPGLPDYGTMSFALIRNYDDPGQSELAEMYASQEARTFIVTLPATNPIVTKNVITFTGWVQSLTTNIGADDSVKGVCSVRIISTPVET
jgi:hypothetical protein